MGKTFGVNQVKLPVISNKKIKTDSPVFETEKLKMVRNSTNVHSKKLDRKVKPIDGEEHKYKRNRSHNKKNK